MYRIYMETSRNYPGILEMTLERGWVGRPIKVLHPLHISGFRGKWINLAVGCSWIHYDSLYFSLQDCILQYWNTFLKFSLIIDVLHDRITFLELFGISPTVVRSFSSWGTGPLFFRYGFFGDPLAFTSANHRGGAPWWGVDRDDWHFFGHLDDNCGWSMSLSKP